MKKILVIILLLLYLPAISGVAVNKFYCCGKIASVRIQILSKMDLHPGQNEGSNCCNDVINFFKVQDAQQVSSLSMAIHVPILQLHTFLPVMAFSHRFGIREHTPPYIILRYPDPSGLQGIYLTCCSLLI